MVSSRGTPHSLTVIPVSVSNQFYFRWNREQALLDSPGYINPNSYDTYIFIISAFCRSFYPFKLLPHICAFPVSHFRVSSQRYQFLSFFSFILFFESISKCTIRHFFPEPSFKFVADVNFHLFTLFVQPTISNINHVRSIILFQGECLCCG